VEKWGIVIAQVKRERLAGYEEGEREEVI